MAHGEPSFRKAFTLVELLVVIAVIAILTSLLLPALASAKTKVQSIVCQGNLRSSGSALSMYLMDNGDRLPIYTAYGNSAWSYTIHEYIPSASPVPGKSRGLMNDAKLVTRCAQMPAIWDYWYPDWGQTILSHYKNRLEMMPYSLALTTTASGASRELSKYALLRDFSTTAASYGDLLHNGRHNALFADWHVESKKGLVNVSYESYAHYYF